MTRPGRSVLDVIEQQDLEPRRVGAEDAEVDPAVDDRRTDRRGPGRARRHRLPAEPTTGSRVTPKRRPPRPRGSPPRSARLPRRLIAPVDAGDVAPIEDLRPATLAEVIPAPVDEGVDAVAEARHEGGVDAEPGRERDPALELVVVAHLGDRGAAADHRHDALVEVVERLAGLALDVGRGCSWRPTCRSAGRPSRAAAASRRRRTGCSRCRRRRRRPGKPSIVKSCSTSIRPPRLTGRPAAAAIGAAGEATAPDDAASLDRRTRPRASHDRGRPRSPRCRGGSGRRRDWRILAA